MNRGFSEARWCVLLSGVACAQLVAIPGAEAAPAATDAHATSTSDEIVVSGKAVPGAVIGDVPPENQLNPADIASYGVSTINDLLDQITEQTQSDQGRDSSASPVILVNGKRISGVNEIGDLPTESVLRIDILPEEVALKYGYDAQLKVVNVILRRRFRARVANGGGGGSTDGAGENETADLSYNRIHDNDRISIVARVKDQASVRESDRGVSSTAGTVSDPTDTLGDDSHHRTIEPATRAFTLNGVYAHQLSSKITASVNARATYTTSRALNGYSSADLSVPASSPYAITNSDTTVNRYVDDRVLHQDIDTATAHLGVTLNDDLSTRWRLSLIGAYDHSDVRTATGRGYDTDTLQDEIDSGEADPYGILSSSALGNFQRQQAIAITDTASSSLLANGKLFRLPAGDIAASLKLGGDFSTLSSSTTGVDATGASRLSRVEGNAQIGLDFPLTSRSKHVLGAIGDLSANVTGAVTEVSDYGVLGTFAYGLHWMPRKGISLIASVNEDRQAPTLSELNAPTVTTSNVRVYDYVQGKTVTVTQITGGNRDLKADDRHVYKLGLALAPVNGTKTKLTVMADYLHSITRNAIGTLTSATADAEDAFADRFERDASGALVSVDSRSVNFDKEDREELRWGFNFTRILRAPRRPPPPPGGPAGWMRRHGPSSLPTPASADGAHADTTKVATGTLSATGHEGPSHVGSSDSNNTSDASGTDGQQPIVVTGQKDRDAGNGFGPPPPDGMDPSDRPPPDGGPDGPPPGGPPPDGMGPPPGGGGPGGGGPPPGAAPAVLPAGAPAPSSNCRSIIAGISAIASG